MKIINTLETARHIAKQVKACGNRIAFVPTMGNLHEGHLSLVRKARELADFVIVSIYVNSMQFGHNEDFDTYPKTFAADKHHLEQENVDAVFAPTEKIMYPEGQTDHTRIQLDCLDGMHCGLSRPQFFSGVATVVTKLFNIVTPDVAVFGEKDFQQLCVIKKIVHDLMMPVEIVSGPTCRDENGLALSSRNNYLTHTEKKKAAGLYALIQKVASKISAGERDYTRLSQFGIEQMQESGFVPDYFNIVSTKTLKPPSDDESSLVILAACTLNNIRLIDNMQIQID
ncbi:MAG: pantoate--beta-alanine ligase [Endozoicomonadaceae bacterium]|nr:pantoate--beta-alanine ligase [Endozoicomonadaceae bacterium]MCY4330599.1 pantoate--beta-alanine ligase [Endozoicomonadaceae bacterium]